MGHGTARALLANSGQATTRELGGKETEMAWGARVPKRGQPAQEATPSRAKGSNAVKAEMRTAPS